MVDVSVVDELDQPVFGAACWWEEIPERASTREEARWIQRLERSVPGLDAVHTGPDGLAEVPWLEGKRLALVVKKFRRSSTAIVDVPPLAGGGRRAIDVRLLTQTDVVVRGRVLESDGRTPVPFAKLVPHDRAGWPGEGEPVFADGAGEFEIELASFTPGRVNVFGEGFSPRSVRLLDDDGRARNDSDIELVELASVHGIVHWPSREDLEVVYAYGLGELWHGRHELRAPVDPATGRFRIAGVPAEVNAHLRVVRGGKQLLGREVCELESGSDTRIDLVSFRSGQVRGLLSDAEGRVLAGREVWLLSTEVLTGSASAPEQPSFRTVSDADGRYAFQDVRIGRWWLCVAPFDARASLQGFCDETNTIDVVIVDADEVEHDVVVKHGEWITGRVVDPEGDGPGATVWIEARQGGVECGRVVADLVGNFRLGPLPRGEYELVARVDGSLAGTVGRSPATRVSTGRDRVRLELLPGVTRTFTALDPLTGRAAEADWKLFDERGSLLASGRGSRFTTPLLEFKRTLVTATSGDSLVAWKAVEPQAPGEEIVLELQAGGRLQIDARYPRVRGRSQLVRTELNVSGFRLLHPDPYAVVPEGAYRVRVEVIEDLLSQSNFEATQNVSVTPRTTTHARFRFESSTDSW